MKLYHFSEDPGVSVFEPRTPDHRPELQPLVWAVAGSKRAAYCFPRDCPRILLWPTATTTEEDRHKWFGHTEAAMVAHVEYAWVARMHKARLYRYELPGDTFEELGDDPWMLVSGEAVQPLSVETVGDLFQALAEAGAELRIMRSLTPLVGLWNTTVHFSGIRLRNAQGWKQQPSPPPPDIRRV